MLQIYEKYFIFAIGGCILGLIIFILQAKYSIFEPISFIFTTINRFPNGVWCMAVAVQNVISIRYSHKLYTINHQPFTRRCPAHRFHTHLLLLKQQVDQAEPEEAESFGLLTSEDAHEVDELGETEVF